MPMYRKKPVVIEAHELTPNNMEELEQWCGGSIRGVLLHISERAIEIHTLEGDIRANMGDYIIKGVKGEFYPCKPDIFEAIYKQV